MNTVLVVVCVVLAVALGAALFLWARARAVVAAGVERAAVAEAGKDAAERAAGKRVAVLQGEVARLEAAVAGAEARSWLEDFPADAVFTLVAHGEAEVDGEGRAFGVVRDESGRVTPFLTGRRMGHLAIGDCFAGVRGQLVKLDPADLETRLAPPAPAKPAPRAAPPVAAGPADEDLTVPMAGAVPAPPAGDVAGDETVLGGTGRPPAGDRTVFLSPDRKAAPADPLAGLTFLQVIEGPDEGRTFPLPYEGAAIGREPGNVVALADGGASRVHCRIDFESGAFVLRDNGSTNGTLCNDEPVRERALAFGDVIHVADTKLRYTCDGFEQRTSNPAKAIAAFERCVERQADHVDALRNLAFLLEKDVARNREAQPLWDRIARLEKSG